MLDYLESQAFSDAAAAFQREAALDAAAAAGGRGKGLLVKKWTTIVRLSKQVADLEKRAQVAEAAAVEAAAAAAAAASAAHQSGDQASGGGEASGARPRAHGGTRMLPVSGKTHLVALKGHRDTVTCVRAHPVYGLVASGSDDGTVKAWDVESRALEKTLRGHAKAVNHVCFDPNGDTLASCSTDLTIKLWSLTSYECTRTLTGHDHTVSAVAFLASGDQLVSGSRDGTLKLWETGTGYCVKTLAEARDPTWVRCVAVSPDGATVASAGNDPTIRVWQLQPGTCVQSLSHHDQPVQALAFSPYPACVNEGGAGTSQLLASGGRDSLVCVWEMPSGLLLYVISDHSNWVNDLFFHILDCRILLSCADDRSVRVTDVAKRRALRCLEDAHGHFVTSIALAPHVAKLVSSGVDKELRIWDCR